MKKILSIIAIMIMAVALFSCADNLKENLKSKKYLNSKGDIYTKGDTLRINDNSFTFSLYDGRQSVDVREFQVGGHSYIVATSIQLIGTRRPGGVSIIHSAGCNCLKK